MAASSVSDSDGYESFSGEEEDDDADGYESFSGEEEDDDAHFELGVALQPYQFEPDAPAVAGGVAAGAAADDDVLAAANNEFLLRAGRNDWCKCDNCQPQAKECECNCCREHDRFMGKILGVENVRCVTDHPGFKAVCLNGYVLEVAWLQYRQQYGKKAYSGAAHKRHRHVAYRQLVRWVFGFLGRDVRVPLPSCAVSAIRAHFPPPGLEENFVFEGFIDNVNDNEHDDMMID